VLQTSFILFTLPPHHRNFGKRLIKSPKLYFFDTGLACRLLRIGSREQLESHPLRGLLFENFVVAEVAKAYYHHRRTPPLYFWRDRTGHEVDLIVEEGADPTPIEIKSGATLTADMLDGLLWWARTAGYPDSRSLLVYGGEDAATRHDIAVRPWFSI
jgi:predicted AAA+ superfamily ATPase